VTQGGFDGALDEQSKQPARKDARHKRERAKRTFAVVPTTFLDALADAKDTP